MNEDTRRAIVAEIVAATRVRVKQPHQFDVLDFLAQQPGMTYQRAYRTLTTLANDGVLQTELVNEHGKQVRVWWRAGDEPE